MIETLGESMTDLPIQKAVAVQDVTRESVNLAAFPVRTMVHDDLRKKLADFTVGAVWQEEPEFEEIETTRFVNVYADDADWDDGENPPEPIGQEAVPMVTFRATARFARE